MLIPTWTMSHADTCMELRQDLSPSSPPQVEMLSHFGSEHYCPLSLLRVLGASMMEVFEYSERQEQSGRSIVLPSSEEEIMGGWVCV